MLTVVGSGTALICGVAAVWSVVEMVQARRPGWVTVGLVAAAELGALACSGIVVALWASGTAPDTPLAWGYVLCAVGVLPAAFFWGIGDSTRWGNVAITVGCLTAAVLAVRMVQIWGGAAA